MKNILKLCLYCVYVIILFNNIYGGGKPQLYNISEKEGVVIFLAGDMMIGNRITPVVDRFGVLYPFKNVINLIKESDISFCNLEAPFFNSNEPPKFEKEYSFKVSDKYIGLLTEPGIDIVSLANNHIMDFGGEGLISTIEVLDKNGIYHCGAGKNIEEANKTAIIEKKGIKIAFLAYSMTFPKEFYAGKDSPGTAYPDLLQFRKSIKKANSIADFIIISMHWSAEGERFPKQYQKFFAHFAVDCGADMIIGHHPHVIQGIEVYKDGLIFYSLGNFIFGSYGEMAREGIIVKTEIYEKKIKNAQVIPINVNNTIVNFQPKIFKDKKLEEIIYEINNISKELNGNKNVLYKNGEIILDKLSYYNN